MWRELYDKAIAFRDLACWQWMSDTDVFGVQNSANGEIGYCCVLGEMGELFGLVVYLGTEGLAIHRQIQSGTVQPSSTEERYSQNCLTLWFSSRAELDKHDLATAKRLGYNFTGRHRWPQFRSMRPGYCPWHLTENEARYFTDCLDQAKVVAMELREDAGYLDAPKHNHYLVRLPLGDGASDAAKQRRWQSEWRQPAPLVETPLPQYPIDELRMQRIKNTCPARSEIWEIDAFYSPSPVAGEERPYFPHTYLCVDQQSGMILDSVLTEPSKWPSAFPQALLATIEKHKFLPDALWIRNEPLLELLAPLARRLGVDVVSSQKLSSLDPAKHELIKFLGRQK